jgi:hypothetical protein
MSEVEAGPGRGRWLAIELAVAFAASALFFWSCFTIRVKAIDRVGQVSGMASLGFRFVVVAMVFILVLLAAQRWRNGVHFDRTTALVCAATAGIVSGMVAGGILVALHGTPYGLGGDGGDTAVLADWARRLQQGEPTPAIYPPLHIYGIAWLADLFHTTTEYAMKQFQLLALVLVCPIAYASWRLLLRPLWALGIGVTIALPLIEAYRLYPFIVLIAFLPIAIRFLQILAEAADHDPMWLARRGALFGAAFGLMFLIYSGWYEWSAPGFLVTAAIVFPWRKAPRRGFLLCAIGALVFVAVTWRYLNAILHGPSIEDPFMYFDSRVDPSYVAMWRGDLPGVFEKLGLWPPAGELAGVGVFTLLLVVAFGIALVRGRGRTVVLGVVSIMLGAWLLRLWYASHMWQTKLVQLYPRTTAELLYGSLILCGFAACFATERYRALRTASTIIGGSCAVLLLSGFAASATLDRFMPKLDCRDAGYLAWRALNTPKETAVNLSRDASVGASSSLETWEFSKDNVVDGKINTGYSSEVSTTDDREEWIEVRFRGRTTFSRVVLQAAAEGFPADFTIEVWTGDEWQVRLSQRGYQAFWGAELFSWNQSETTNRIRIRATKLGALATKDTMGGAYALRLREIEVYR